MRVSVYIVDRQSLKKQKKVQEYGDTQIALSRCAMMLADLEGDMVYLENVRWKEYGIKVNSILAYDTKFDWGFVITNSELERKRIGPFKVPQKSQSPDDNEDSD